MNPIKEIQGIISVSGLGYTGSSALIDYFSSIDEVSTIETEFFLFRIVDGFFDLYYRLIINNMSFAERHYVVYKFRIIMFKLARHRYRRETRVAMGGMVFHIPLFKNILGANLKLNIIKFIKELIVGEIRVNLVHSYLTMPNIRLIMFKFIVRISGVLFRLRFIKKRLMLYEKLPLYSSNSNDFISSLNNFINNLTQDLLLPNNKPIVLNQSVDPLELSRLPNIIPNHKIIVVIRDPRDIFAEVIKYKIAWMVGAGNRASQLRNFILYQNNVLNKFFKVKTNNDLLTIKFEDLCLNTIKTINLVHSFLGIENTNRETFANFNPIESMKNIGIYKSLLSREELKIIYEEINLKFNYYINE